MITAQDIREKTFEKSRIGGYDMASVDNFLEEIADDITSAQKENSVLKSKMKVLVDKIEEYRANEEALNLAVISAQKLAVQIEADARTRARLLLEILMAERARGGNKAFLQRADGIRGLMSSSAFLPALEEWLARVAPPPAPPKK